MNKMSFVQDVFITESAADAGACASLGSCEPESHLLLVFTHDYGQSLRPVILAPNDMISLDGGYGAALLHAIKERHFAEFFFKSRAAAEGAAHCFTH